MGRGTPRIVISDMGLYGNIVIAIANPHGAERKLN